MPRLSQFSFALLACLAALAMVLGITWPKARKRIAIDLPFEVSSSPFDSFLVRPPTVKKRLGVPTDCLPFYNNVVVASFLEPTRSQEFYAFVDWNSNRVSLWNLTESQHLVKFGQGFDTKGRYFIVLGEKQRRYPMEPAELTLRRFDRLANTEETIPLTAAADFVSRGLEDSPGNSSKLLANQVSEDGSIYLELRGGAVRPLEAIVTNLDDHKVRWHHVFHERIGELADGRSDLASGDWELSPAGRFLALSESWRGGERTPAGGLELWDTFTGRLHQRVQMQDQDLPPDDSEGFPRRSRRRGFQSLWFSNDEKLLGFTYDHRKRDSPKHSWLFEPSFQGFMTVGIHPHGNVDSYAIQAQRTGWEGHENAPYFETVTNDGSLAMWLDGFPRWRLKTVWLSDRSGKKQGISITFPESIRPAVSDDFGGSIVPGTKSLVMRDDDGEQGDNPWWSTLPSSLHFLKRVDESPRVYSADFETGQIDCLWSSGGDKSLKCLDVAPIPKGAAVLISDHRRPYLEILDIPMQKPAWGVALASSLLCGAFFWGLSRAVGKPKKHDKPG